MGSNPDSAAAIHPIFGHLGQLFVVIAFVAALFACLSFYFSVRRKNADERERWKQYARFGFFAHAASVLGIVLTMFFMIFNHYFEYQYVWAHSSLDLPKKYILASFWEGQEGSFLLWIFWEVMLGIIIILTQKKWEAPVMTVLCAVQVFLLSFLLGIYIGNFHIGNSPFLLLQDALTRDPVFLYGDYMKFIQDGSGLNALLQNYWMVIHPPVLFCGFASITVPFAFAIGGLWTKDYTGWLKPALPFTLFAGMVLGTGVLMGGAWAYEALSFGGFWAWDPVENASLIPWLVLVAALHTLLVSKSTGHALRTTYTLFILAFFMVLYASFLTRSGVLRDSSVHAFVEEGLFNHLLLFLFAFTVPSVWLLAKRWKHIPAQAKEESASSREFWMFVGSLVLLFAGLHIVAFTSIPVYNQFFSFLNNVFGTHLNTDLAPVQSPVLYFTSVQIWVAIGIALLTAFAQFLKYRKTGSRKFFTAISISFCIAVAATVISCYLLEHRWYITRDRGEFRLFSPYGLLLLAAFFSIAGNLQYFIQVLRGKIRIGGSSVAHIGFGILLLGILISNAGQKVISQNTLGIDYGKDFDQKFKRENTLLYHNVPQSMGDFIVSYAADSDYNGKKIYTIHFEKINNSTGASEGSFNVYPYLLMDKKSQKLTPDPDTRHFLTYDVFTHISSIPTEESRQKKPESSEYTIGIGDTIFLSDSYMIMQDFRRYPSGGDTIYAGGVFAVHAGDSVYSVEPKVRIFSVDDQQQYVAIPEDFAGDKDQAAIVNILPDAQPAKTRFVVSVRESEVNNDWVILKAILFPMINLVWLGMALMASGFLISILRRVRENRRAEGLE